MQTLNEWLQHARTEGYAIGHFNIASIGQLYGIVEAAQATNAPVILGTSEGEAGFLGYDTAVALRDVMRQRTGLPIFLNADHHRDPEKVLTAVKAGYDSVHYDGSRAPLEENMAETRTLYDAVKEMNPDVSFEGEVSPLPTESSQVYEETIEVDPETFTRPEDAQRFVAETNVDRLAAAFGTLHGISKEGTNPSIDLDLLKKIGAATDAFLVLHGGSGTPETDLRAAAEGPIVKAHVSTEIRVAFAGALREALRDESAIKPYNYFPPAVAAVRRVVEEKIALFGSADKAQSIDG